MNATQRTGGPIEITLPSGIFARIRPVKFLDNLVAGTQAREIEVAHAKDANELRGAPMFAVVLIARCVIFDDRQFTVEQVLDLDSRDTNKLCEALLPYLTGPIR